MEKTEYLKNLMGVGTTILSNLFQDTQLILNVPNYQRKYIWKSDNCNQLLNDIFECVNNNKFHFMGSIVYKEQSLNLHSKNDLVDGQQRITTIMLIAKALSLLADNTSENIKKFIYTNDNKTRLTLSNEDNHTFSLIMDSVHLQNIPDPTSNSTLDSELKNSQLLKNFWLILDYLNKKINNENFKIDDIYQNGLNKLYFIGIKLGNEVNPQEIFESINSLGVKLTPVEEIKNYLLWKLENADEIYENKWKPIENKIGDHGMDDFIMDYLMAKEGRVVNQKYLYEEYKKYAKHQDAHELIDELDKYATYYSYFLGRNKYPNPTIDELLEEIRNIGLTTVYPFLLRVFDDRHSNKIDDPTLGQVLNLFVIYLVRRIICKVPSGGLRGFIATLYNRLSQDKCDNQNYYANVWRFLSNYLTGQEKMPDSEETKNKLLGFNLYWGKNRFCDYLLLALENKRYLDKSNYPVTVNNVTVEHIVPKAINNENWITMLGSDLDEIKNNWLHTIGNLTLLTGKDNSKIGNKPYNIKKDKYINENKLIVLNGMFKDYDKFTLNEIQQRGKYLIDIFDNYFKLPTPDQKALESIKSINYQKNNENTKDEKIADLLSENLKYDDWKVLQIVLKDNKNNKTEIGPELIKNNWKAVLISALQYCFEKQLDVLKFLNENKWQYNTDKNNFKKEEKPALIPTTNYFIKTNLSAADALKRTIKLLENFNLEGYVKISKKIKNI